MLDFGFDKMALIGAVALIVIGPEKLPRVARTVGTLLGKAQRYVADVKAEVNRSIELEELQKMRSQFETAARDVHDTVQKEFNETRAAVAGKSRRPSESTSAAARVLRSARITPGASWCVARSSASRGRPCASSVVHSTAPRLAGSRSRNGPYVTRFPSE